MYQPEGPDFVPSGVSDNIANNFPWFRITFITSILWFLKLAELCCPCGNYRFYVLGEYVAFHCMQPRKKKLKHKPRTDVSYCISLK